MSTKFYLIDVTGCTDPSAVGPFDSSEERDGEAKTVRAGQGEEDALFWADVDAEGILRVGAYSGGFFDEAEDEA